LAVPQVRAWARSAAILSRVTTYLGPQAQPVRAIFFDKSPTTNWLVPWHQDVTLAVESPVDAPGFGPWSRKDGVSHVQAPGEWLARMITVRLHFDDCDGSNGALRVIPGSHRYGRLDADRMSALKEGDPRGAVRGGRWRCPAHAAAPPPCFKQVDQQSPAADPAH
jgi:ectoine hydroxylase-related dioxygenase (phytanoyl-CoA dioxygenase family)